MASRVADVRRQEVYMLNCCSKSYTETFGTPSCCCKGARGDRPRVWIRILVMCQDERRPERARHTGASRDQSEVSVYIYGDEPALGTHKVSA